MPAAEPGDEQRPRRDPLHREPSGLFPKPINISAQVLLDRERCVLCARCTRFSEQIAGDPFIALIERGALQQVGIYEKEPFETYFSGNTIQICPVGRAHLGRRTASARGRSTWSPRPSIAEHDACGSAIRVDHRRGKVMRRLAGDDPEVNEEWITDKDRFAFAYARQTDRLTHPMVRDDETGELRPASLARGVRRRAPAALRDAGGVGVLTGGRLTAEDAYAYAQVRAGRARHQRHRLPGPPALRRGGRVPGLRGGVAAATTVTYADLETRPVVVLVGLEPEDEAGTIFLRLRKAARGRHAADLLDRAVHLARAAQDVRHADPDPARRRGRRDRRRCAPRQRRRARQGRADPRRRAAGRGARRAVRRGRPGRRHRRPARLGPASRG